MNEVVPIVDRTKLIGGSDIAALLGIAPKTWERNSPAALWKDKMTPRSGEPERPDRGVKGRGKRWESVVAEMLVEHLMDEGHTVELVSTNRRYTDKTIPYFSAEIDFEVKLDGAKEITNVELKTVHAFKANEWGESGTDTTPLWYAAQAMWGLGVTGRDTCLVAPLFGADEIRVFPVERDEGTIAALRLRAETFWKSYVLTGIAPPPLQLSDMTILYPRESAAPALIADEQLTGTVLRLRAVDKEITARQAEWDALAFEIQQQMGDCGELIVHGKSAVAWKQRPHTHLDQGALKAGYPEIHRELTRKGSSRVFSLRSFGWEG
jgi:predicted phage-related endonuclease